jgi:hypothetical protein
MCFWVVWASRAIGRFAITEKLIGRVVPRAINAGWVRLVQALTYFDEW